MAQSEAISKIRHKKKAAKKRLYIFLKKNYSAASTETFLCAPSHFTVPSTRAKRV